MKKRLILLIDFSDYSGNLIKYACDWGKRIDAELLLVHQSVVLAPVLTDNESRQEIAKYTNDDALNKLKSLANEFIPSTVAVSYLVFERQLQPEINRLLAEPFDQLIFAGLKGTGLLKKIFLGSVALQVIENANNIVVAMPKEVSAFSHKKLFVAVTEQHPLNLAEFNRLLGFIDSKNTSISFFYLSKPNEETAGIESLLNKLADLYSDKFTTKTSIYSGSNPFEDIKKVINNAEEEVLIVQKGSRLFTDMLFRRFLINELVYEGKTPLITLP